MRGKNSVRRTDFTTIFSSKIASRRGKIVVKSEHSEVEYFLKKLLSGSLGKRLAHQSASRQ